MNIKSIVTVTGKDGTFISKVGCETESQVNAYIDQMKMLYGSSVKVEAKKVPAKTKDQ